MLVSNTGQLLPTGQSEYTSLAGHTVHIETVATAGVSVFAAAFCVIGLLMHVDSSAVSHHDWWMTLVLAAAGVVALAATAVICTLPQQGGEGLKFKAPGVPIMPLVSVAINIYLLFSLDKWTWVRFVVWLAIGVLRGWVVSH